MARLLTNLLCFCSGIITVFLLGASLVSAADEDRQGLRGLTNVTPYRILRSVIRGTSNAPSVFGLAAITEENNGKVTIEASVNNLSDGCHGFHVHLYGDEVGADDGTAAAGHWNPNEVDHAGPTDDVRHVGDLGNICSTNGYATYTRTFEADDLARPAIISNFVNSIIGRSFVIHAGQDDLESQPTGAAGPRDAIGIIGIGNQDLYYEETGRETAEVTEHITADDFEVPLSLVCKIRGDGIVGFGAVTVVDEGIEFRASVYGLEPGKRGYHIHWYGEEYLYTDSPDPSLRDLSRAGGHYDPTNVAHGLPDDPFREYGDGGNIIVDNTGYGFTQVILPSGIPDLRSLVGRTCLIHMGEDTGLEPAGQAGPRIAAGQLGYANPNTSIITPPQCLVKDCCEDDCCGEGTSWDSDVTACVKDENSTGYTGDDGSVQGCDFQSCCEDGCCYLKFATVYDPEAGCCVPVLN